MSATTLKAYLWRKTIWNDLSQVVGNIVLFSHKLRGRNQIQKNQLPLHIIRMLPMLPTSPPKQGSPGKGQRPLCRLRRGAIISGEQVRGAKPFVETTYAATISSRARLKRMC
jgi:hypothetical protein